jgi:hypothetical protein
MQSEQAMKLMQNEGVVKALTKAFTATTEVRQAIDQQVGAILLALGNQSVSHTPLSSDAFDQTFGSAKAHGATI